MYSILLYIMLFFLESWIKVTWWEETLETHFQKVVPTVLVHFASANTPTQRVFKHLTPEYAGIESKQLYMQVLD